MPGRFQGHHPRQARRPGAGPRRTSPGLGDRVLAVVPSDAELEKKVRLVPATPGAPSSTAFRRRQRHGARVLLRLVAIPLPGGILCGSRLAAGPPVAGMVQGGWAHRASCEAARRQLTIRQLGLLFFLAAIGPARGPSSRPRPLSMTQDSRWGARRAASWWSIRSSCWRGAVVRPAPRTPVAWPGSSGSPRSSPSPVAARKT